MAKASLSGFPEWLPEGRIIEQSFLDTLRTTFELHGFSSIETRAVEPLSELTRKGETSKEVYLLSRLQADPTSREESDPKKKLGLHFDLTVPFARYVLEHAGQLTFPFKRYQIQKVWRGERPQEGRFREFIQADIDVVGDGTLPLHFDAELPLIMHEALSALPIPPVVLHISNRKVAQGFYEALGLGSEQMLDVLRVVDKLDKIGPEAVRSELMDSVALSADQADAALRLATISSADPQQIRSAVTAALDGVPPTELLSTGLDELATVIETCQRRRPGSVIADLKIARGLDYYTGTVYESVLVGHEDLGSICSGGRYDSLATNGKRTFPGVGLSIGVSRLLARIIGAGLVSVTRPVPTCVLVAVTDEADRAISDAVADTLRARGISADVSPTAAKFGKQIKFADKRGIPFVWFPGMDGEADSVKDIRCGDQVDADAATWLPPLEDLAPSVAALIETGGVEGAPDGAARGQEA